MKRILTTIGAGRLIAVALTAGIAAGALVAAPLFASASGAEDTPTSERESPASQSLLDRVDWPAFIESSDITTDAYRWATGGDDEFGVDWTVEDSSNSGPSFGFAADFGSGNPVHVGGNLVETVAELTGTDEDAVVQALEDGQTLAEFAEAHGVSEDALLDALLSDAEEKLNEAVEEGNLTEEQADRIRTELREHLSGLINGDGPFERFGIDHPDHPGAFPFFGGMGGHFALEFDPLATVAELTGAEIEDIFAALEEGQTLAEFAAEHDVSEDELVAAIMAGAEERAAEAVAEGDLTQEEADEMLANFEEHARAMINGDGFGVHRGVVPGRLEGFDGFFMPGECDDDGDSQESDGESTSSQI